MKRAGLLGVAGDAFTLIAGILSGALVGIGFGVWPTPVGVGTGIEIWLLRSESVGTIRFSPSGDPVV